MSPLVRLWLVKQKGTLRNLFRKPASAIMTIFMIVVYGGLICLLLFADVGDLQMQSLHNAVLLSIGFTAIISFSMLLQKRKALFYENDSFYLFCGPFRRAQIMRFLMGQTLIQAFMLALLSSFMFICFGAGIPFTFMLIIFSISGHFLTYMFFLNLVDYLYLLGICHPKYKIVSKLVAGCYIAFIIILFLIVLMQNEFALSNSLMAFAQSDLFYFIPLFGWVKMLMIMYTNGNTVFWMMALCMLVLANVIVYLLTISFKGDFYEQAMMDASEVSVYVAQMKEGKKSMTRLNAKVHTAHVSFHDGAGAIFSKNLLMMKKTRDFLSLQDVFILVFYFVISLLTDLGFGMYCYMIVIWLFQILQTSDLVNELKNYQIYLLPAKPFAKLWYALLPTLIKVVALMSAAVVIGGVFYRMSLTDMIQYWIMLFGYACIFISGTVLSIRILKSRTNQLLENMLRMLLILLCSLPGIALTLYMFISGDFSETNLFLAGNLSLVLNIVLSFVILYLCKNMMNGRELSSDS